MNKFPKGNSKEVKNTHEPHLAGAVFETQISGSCKSFWLKCYFFLLLSFSKHSLLLLVEAEPGQRDAWSHPEQPFSVLMVPGIYVLSSHFLFISKRRTGQKLKQK